MAVDFQTDFDLPEDAQVAKLYTDYLSALPSPFSDDLESLIHPHRHLNFRWRSILSRHNADERVLGHLYEKVGAAFCASIPAGTNEDHPSCQPNEWIYDVPKDPEQQARQLLREQRRLERHIEFLRNPIEPHAGNRSYPPQPRELRPYEKEILAAWDEAGTIPLAVDQLLAEYIHESVAAFTSWPCALWEQRGIYCDGTRYLAQNDPVGPSDAAVA